MNKLLLRRFRGFAAVLCVCLPLLVISVPAQTVGANSTNTPATKPPPSPVEEYSTKLGKLNKNPAEYVATLAEFINKFPYSERAFSYYYSVRTVLKNSKDAEEVRNLSNKLIKDTEPVPAAVKI